MKNIKKLVVNTITMILLGTNLLVPVASAAALGEHMLSISVDSENVKQLLQDRNIDGAAGEDTKTALSASDPANVQALHKAPTQYKKVYNIIATAYAPGAHDNGKWGSLTHLGTRVRPGVIAVDPALIPLGSKVYIEFADGHGTYAVAEDTGGAIKGNRIDIAMRSVAEAYDFGKQKVKVYVVE